MSPSAKALLILAAVIAAPVHADELDRRIQAAMREDRVPGVALAVVRGGKIVRLGSYGVADLEWSAKVTRGTRFEIASMSKMFTGAAARLLIDQGKLDPEAPISRYLDGLPAALGTLKVRHLITMSTGLPEDWGSDVIPYAADVIAPADDAAMIKAFATLKPAAGVGEAYHYSSPGYALLGMIVAKLSGEPLARFVDRQLFGPAGMTESSFVDNWAIVPERAQGYRRAGDKLQKGWYLGQYLHARPDVGVLSSARDLARWMIALQQRKLAVDPEKLWEGTKADSGRWLDYAYGWHSDLHVGHRRVGHDGQFRTGFRSKIEHYPDDGLTVIVLANCDCANTDRIARLAVRSYLRDLPDLEAASARPDPEPDRTASAIAALQQLGQGKLDERVLTPDALDPMPLAEATGALSHVRAYRHAGHARIAARIHGHTLVACDIIRCELPGGAVLYLALYRDEGGKIAYITLI